MRILIVDDHAIVREGLGRLLSANGKHQIIGVANGVDALATQARFYPDIIVLDLDLPGLGGVALLSQLVREGAGRILVLTMHAEPLYVRRALEAGAHGYLTKNATPDEILLAIGRVSSGQRYIEADIAQSLVLDDGSSRSTLDGLKPREIEILRLLSRGAGLNEIAGALGISYKTAANTCSLIRSKLGVARTADLVRLALEAGIA